MTQYLLSVNGDMETLPPPEDIEQSMKDVDVVNDEMKAQGVWVFGGGLHPPATATVVRADDKGDIVTTDGPFLETKEQIGGFWVIDVDDLDAALSWAAKATVACRWPVEVRPFQDEPEG